MTDVRKKRKHIQTAPTRRNSKDEARGASLSAAAVTWAGACDSLMIPRSRTTETRERRPTAAAAQAAVRQPASVAMPVMNTGAAAQPMFPDRPCAEKAWPSLAGDTLRLRTV